MAVCCTHVHCRKKNISKGRRRRFAKSARSAVHETVITGYALDGTALPPVWVLNRKTIDDETRKLMREALKDCPMFFNGRWIIPCACVAGGSSGGVNRDNFSDVLIEFERYLDSDEYDVDSDGVRHILNKDWKPKAPVYTFTDWHDSCRCYIARKSWMHAKTVVIT